MRSILPRTCFISGRLCGRKKVKTEPSFQTNMINSQRFKVNLSSRRIHATLLVNGVGYEDLHTIKNKNKQNRNALNYFRSRQILATLLASDAGSEDLREDLWTHFYATKNTYKDKSTQILPIPSFQTNSCHTPHERCWL